MNGLSNLKDYICNLIQLNPFLPGYCLKSAGLEIKTYPGSPIASSKAT